MRLEKNPLCIVLKYLGGIHNHWRRKVILFEPRTINEMAYVHALYLENMDKKKGKPSGFKKKDTQDTSKDLKKKWKVKDKRKINKLHTIARIQITIVINIVISMVTSKMNPKNHKKYAKKRNMIDMD